MNILNDKYNIRPASNDEILYSYTQGQQIAGQTGAVGYMRGDFGDGGQNFYTSWFDINPVLKTDDIKDNFNYLINTLNDRDFLQSAKLMRAFFKKAQATCIEGNFGVESVMRIDSGNYSYIFRVCPASVDYDFYVFAYMKDQLDRHIANASKGIRFINPSYNTLFMLNDGDKITINYADGSKEVKTCRYIDEYHTQVGNSLYHICQFAELMEKNGNTVEPFNKLPDKADNHTLNKKHKSKDYPER
ncbi:MAG: hypothetical protein IKF64_05870 [Eubacterium sp.]|nr:hypothetical protein [Eubacterium sp.]